MKSLILATALSLALFGTAIAQTSSQNVQITNGPVVEGTGDTWAVIAWTTNVGSSSVIHYGTDQNNLTQTAQQEYQRSESNRGVNHRVHIKNLQPGTTYYFRVDSGQGESTGTNASSNVDHFTTKQAGQSQAADIHITDGPRVEHAADTWAVIAWTTDRGGSSRILYGTDANNLGQTAESPYSTGTGSTTHRVRITGLQPGTTYYFVVDSGQAQGSGSETKSQVAQFTTEKK